MEVFAALVLCRLQCCTCDILLPLQRSVWTPVCLCAFLLQWWAIPPTSPSTSPTWRWWEGQQWRLPVCHELGTSLTTSFTAIIVLCWLVLFRRSRLVNLSCLCSELVVLVVILSCFVTSFDILCYVWRFDDHMLMVHGDLMMHECLIIICDIHWVLMMIFICIWWIHNYIFESVTWEDF